MNPLLLGSLKSKTMWAAALLLIASNLQPLWPQIGAALHMAPPTIQLLGSIFSIVFAALRTVTTGSLADKANPVLPPPQASSFLVNQSEKQR